MDNIFTHNFRWLKIYNIFRGLIFTVAVWILWERQYLSMAQIIVVEGLIQGSQMVFEMPTGAFADIFGRRVSIATGLLMQAGLQVMFLLITTFPMYLVMALLWGLSEALISGAVEALEYDSLKEAGQESKFSQVSSTLSLYFQIPFAIATVLSGVIGSVSLALPIIMWMCTLLMSAYCALRLREPHIDSVKFSVANYIGQIKNGAKAIVESHDIKLLSIFYILVGSITWMCTLTFLHTVLVDVGHNVGEIGIGQGIIRIANTLLLFWFVRTRYFTESRSYILFAILLPLSLLPALLLDKWAIFASITVISICSTARWQILSGYVNAHFASGVRATAISTLSMCISIIYVLVAIVLSPLILKFGDTRAILTFLGIVSLFTVLPFGLYLSRRYSS